MTGPALDGAESPVAESPVAESPVAESPVGESPVGESPVAEDPGTAPGSPQALDRGCACPTLANASYRVGADPTPLIDPACPLHTG